MDLLRLITRPAVNLSRDSVSICPTFIFRVGNYLSFIEVRKPKAVLKMFPESGTQKLKAFEKRDRYFKLYETILRPKIKDFK